MANLRLSVDVMNTKNVRDYNRAKFEISQTNKTLKKSKVFERVNSLNRVLQKEANVEINDVGVGYIAMPKSMVERAQSQVLTQAKTSDKNHSKQKFSSIYDHSEAQNLSVQRVKPARFKTMRNSL